MKIIGITGGFGTGKTTVGGMFKKLGGIVINADEIAHGLFKRNSSIYKKIIKTFGINILSNAKTINRVRLADLVFSSPKRLKSINKITHPAIIRLIKTKLASIKKRNICAVVFIDAALLIESKFYKKLDITIVVTTSRKSQIKRLLVRGLSNAFINKVIKNQMPLRQKVKLADYTIDNSKTKNQTFKKVRLIWNEICIGG